MGSSGTNSFSDYPGSRGGSAFGEQETATSGQANSSGSGAPGQSNSCERIINHALLEDVSRCQYFKTHQKVPPAGTDVYLSDNLEGGRLAVACAATGLTIGYLPTMHNDLFFCMQNGYAYRGRIISSSPKPVPNAKVTLQYELK